MKPTPQDRVIKAMCTELDPHATKVVALEALVGRDAIEAAREAGYIEFSKNGRWTSGTSAGFERWNEIRPQPKAKRPSTKRDMGFEEALIRAEVAVELLEHARPGKASAEERRTLNQIAAGLMRPYLQIASRPALYAARIESVDQALDRLV